MKKILSSALYILTFVVYVVTRAFSSTLPVSSNISEVVSVPDSIIIYDSTVKKRTAIPNTPAFRVEVVKSGKTKDKVTKTSSVLVKPETIIQSTPPQMHKGVYLDGIYTGSLADAYYEKFQVRVEIKNGVIAKVYPLPYKQNNNTSRYINGYAMPVLRSEALTAQSANVDIISGATETSRAFRTSLTSALLKAS